MLNGIDVAHHNGTIDWSRVSRAGTAFAFMKATEGRGWVDECFERNIKGAKQCGVLVGAYHYFKPDGNAAQQAHHFLDTVMANLGGFTGMLPPVLDVEEQGGMTREQLTASVAAWIGVVGEACDRSPILYVNANYANNVLLPEFDLWPLWLAHYTADGPWDNPAKTLWASWTFWQYDDHGKCPGVSGDVDVNVYHYSARELAALVIQ